MKEARAGLSIATVLVKSAINQPSHALQTWQILGIIRAVILLGGWTEYALIHLELMYACIEDGVRWRWSEGGLELLNEDGQEDEQTVWMIETIH